MKSKLSAAIAAVGCALALSVGAASADVITTFDVSATFDSSCSGCSLGGTITVDVTAGTIQSANITITGQSVGPFTTSSGYGSSSSGQFSEDFTSAAFANLALWFPGSGLQGYSGGEICGSASGAACSGLKSAAYYTPASGPTSFWYIADGSLTAEAAAVPGPVVGAGLPGLIMAGGGLLGWWRRKRKAEAAA